MKSQAAARKTDERPFMEELERRLLMSADVFGAFAGNAVYQDVEQPQSESVLQTESDQAVEVEAAEHQSRELIIIDAATPDYESLLADLTGQAEEDRLFEVAILDPTEDGITQISDLLSQYSGLDAVHIISHGNEGSITLGSSVLDYDALIDSARDIEGWGDAFTADGDLLIYGCNLAASEEGQDLVDGLSRLTETDVAASEDLTGAAGLGGDWDLEYRRGDIQATVAVSAAAQANWDAVLPVNNAPTFIDGSVGNWKFDEGSGDSIVESAIGISTGTLGITVGADANDPTWTTGKFGQALHFDGVNDYIEIADAPGIDISGPQFSASLWMNPDSGPNKEDMLFMKGDRQGNINYYLSWKDSGEMTWAFKDSAGWHYQDMPVTMPTTGQWNHIGITFDRPTVSLYVNGAKYVFDNVATGGSMDRDLTANDEVLWIGAGREAGALVGVNQWSGPFTGSIDELALFDRALTDAEIEAIRTSTPPAVTASAFSIDENSANNTVVGTVIANDQDIGDTLSYAITAGNTGGAFSIDANGQIKVANSAALDFETNPTFNLTIEATDDGIPSLSDTTTVTISLNDVNDAPVIHDWYNAAWDFRKGVTIDAMQVEDDLSDFPVLITLNADPELVASALANGDDILFTAADGVTKLAHEIESYDSVTGALTVWVKTDLSASLDTQLFMYFGNASATNQQDAANVWGSNYVGVWHLNDAPSGAAGEISDSTSNNNHGTTEGSMDAADLVDGQIGKGLDFDELDDLIRIPDSPSLDSTAAKATFELWAWFDNAADGQHQIIMTSSNRYSGVDGYEWASQGGGDHFFYPDATSPDGNYNLGPNPFNDQQWHHLAATMDFDTKEVIVYVDGTPMAFSYEGVPGMWTSLTSSDDLLFGGNPDRIERFFDGMMDEIRISNVVRSQQWIQTSVNNQSTPGTFFALGGVEGRDLTLTDINEDELAPAGDTVLSMLGSGGGDRISDADSGALEGVSVTGVDDTNGQWQYDANADGTWIAFGSVSDSSAVLLDVGAKIRFVPSADYNGTSGNITFRAWDQTSGGNGQTSIDVSTSGGDTAFSAADYTASLTVNPVSDAPVLDTIGDAALADIDESDFNNAGDLVSDIIASAGGDPITDPDGAASEGIAVTAVDDSNGTWEYSTDGGSSWTAFGAVSDSSAVLLTDSALDRVRFVPDANFNGTATFSYRAWDQTDANTSGTTGVDVSSNGGSTPFSTATETADIKINPVQIVLYFSTFGDVTTSGASGLDSWTSGDLVAFGDPGLSFEPGTTDGTLYATLNLGSFATDADASINAMHFVSRDITVGGANSVDLQTGDLLLAVDGNETFTGSDLVSLDVGQRDLFVFRPDVAGNYSSGSFFLLLDTFASNSVTGVSLVEQNATVGDVTLTAGTFVFNAGNSRDILHFSADDVGAGTTIGTTSTLIDGGDIGFNNSSVVISGLDLIEADGTVSGSTVSAGNLLVTLDSDDNDVGNNHASFLASDIFRLDVITTTMGSGTSVANAYAFIEGADVNLESAAEEVSALSLDVKFGSANTDPVIGLPGGDVTYTEDTAPEIVDAGATVSDADALNFYQAQLRVDFTVGGQPSDGLEIFDEGTGAGQVGVLGHSVSYGGTTIGTFTGGNNGGQPLVITFNSMATEVAVQSVMRNITYENVSDNPSTVDRIVRFILSDGEGGTSNEVTKTIHVIALPDVTVDPLITNDATPQLTGTVDDPTATIDVTVNGTTYAATNNGDGTWTLADNTIAPALADGTYDVSVTATDALSNVGTDGSTNELTIDTTAPIVTVTGLTTVDNTPALTGTVDDPTATIDVTVNGTTYAATNNGDGTWTLADNSIAPALADGIYDVSVTATDAVGNVGSDASVDELVVDTTAPVVTILGLTTADDTPALTGTVSDPTAAVQVMVDGVTYTATNNGDGTWTLADNTITPALADGTYDVSVTATDGVGNAGSDASVDELVIDTTAPVVTVTGLTTADNTPALTGTVSDPTATVQVTVNGTTYTATNNGDGTWTLADNSIAPALADGTYEVSVTATDTLGNAGTDVSTNELTVDTTAPVVTVTGLTTVDNTPALTGTVSDPTATVDVTVNGTTYAATNNGDGTWTLADNSIAPALADGTYDVSVTATDTLGNAGTDGSTNELTVDTTAPVVTVTGLTTVDNTPALTGTVSDPTATVDVTVNGTTYAATNNGDGTWTLADNSIAPALADGTYDVSVTATDALGNAGTDGSTNELTVDTTAPIVTVTGLSTVDSTPQLTGTVNDPSATVDVTVNGSTYAATNNGDGTWTLADNTIAPALADGTYDVSVTATDALGNAGSDASIDELVVDTTAPIVTVTGLNTTDATPQLSGTVSDPSATVDVTVNGTTYSATNNGDGTWTLADNTIAPALADGTYDVSVTATDTLSNVGTDASTNELTVDTTAPVVTITGLTTADNTPALTGTVNDPTATVDVTVNGTSYAATNNGDGTWTLADDTIAPALADGTYDVSVTATDGLGIVGTDGSSNELTVDTTAPIVTVTGVTMADNTPALTGTVDDPSATVQVTVDGTTYTATNNGDGTWTLADNSIAPALADGTYDVSVTATDAVGNAGSDASVDELVVDTTAPIVTGTGLTTADNTPALAGTVSDPSATVQVTVNGTTYAATNNGDGTWTLADNSIAPALADGTYDVSITATDAVGNVGSDASVDELVVDTSAPVVTVDPINTADATPQLTGTVSDPAATVQITVNGTTYTATNNGDGTWTLADDTIAPALAKGTYDVSVTATDAVGNVGADASMDELVILNARPVAGDDAITTDEDVPFTAVLGLDDLLLNDSDADGDPLTVNTTPVSGPSNGALILNSDGTFTYIPNADFNGTDSFVYEVSDGDGGVAQATVTITVNPINDAPNAVGDGFLTNEDQPVTAVLGVDDLLLNDSDPDGDPLTVNTTPVVGPANGTLVLNSDGTFTYTPDADFDGTDSFTYEISDGNGGTSQAVVTIVVNPVNDAPTTSGIVDVTVNEDAPNTTIDLLSAFNDVDDGVGGLNFTVTQNTNPGLFNSNNINNILGNLTLDYAQDANGSADLTIRATDAAGAWVETTFTVNVTPVNDAPVIGSENITVDEDVSFLAALGVDDLLLNESDVDGDLLSVSATPVTGPANGTVLLNSDGTFTYTPDADFNGTDSFTYEVADGNGGIGQGVVTITVNPVNDAPVAGNESMAVNEDAPLTVVAGISDLLMNDTDADGDALSVNTTPVTGPANGTLVLNSDGTFTYTPNADFNGADSFSYRVSDASGAISDAVVSIAVNPMNDAPVAGADAVTVEGDTVASLSDVALLSNDTDVDGDVLQIVGFTQPGNGSLAQNPDGSLAYTPQASFVGIDSFTYTVADVAGAQDTVMVTVAVTAPPAIINPWGPPEPGPGPGPDDGDDTSGGQESGAGTDKDTGDEDSTDGSAGDPTPEKPPVVESSADPDGPESEVSGPLETALQNSLLDLYGQSDDGAKRPGVTAPKFLYDALQVVETAFDVAIPELALATANEMPIWKALDAMRREMSSPAEESQFGGIMVAQMTTGASLILSAGFVSWILRGGALASALLSTMPMWQGFDPLPILLARKKRKQAEQERAERDAEILRESEVDRLFEAATKDGQAPGRGSPVE